MSKIKNYAMTLDEIIAAGEELVASYKKTADTAEIILNAAKDLRALYSNEAPELPETAKSAAVQQTEPVPQAEAAPKEETKTYSFTQVRGIMAALSSQGKKAEARALLEKYGASRLSEVKPEDYPALVADAKEAADA